MATALFRLFMPASVLLAIAIGCSTPGTDQPGSDARATAANTGQAKGASGLPLPDPNAAAPSAILAQLPDSARSNAAVLYASLCSRCHGLDGTPVVAGAPNLKQLTCPKRAITGTIYSGRGLMPSFGSVLTGGEISRLADYVQGMQENGTK